MPIPKTVEAYLRKANKKFEQISHKTVYTGYDLAQTLKRKLHEVGKALLVKADKAYVLVVLPASKRLDLGKLKKALNAKSISLVPEKAMNTLMSASKTAAITAFGGLHKIQTVVDRGLLRTKDVFLQAGNFTDSVRMKVKDFVKLEQAKLVQIAETTVKAAKKVAAKVKPKRR